MNSIVTKLEMNLLFGRTVPASKVLVLAPHCDDEALGFGGNILKYLKNGAQVCVMFLSNDPEKLRAKETLEAWHDYDNISFEFLGFSDGKTCLSELEAVLMVQEKIMKIQPNLIAVPWYLDKHTDHVYCNRFLEKALEKIFSDKKDYTTTVASYEVNFPLYVNYTVNITDVFAEKDKVIQAYVSQKPDNLRVMIEHLNRYRAEQMKLKRVKYAEALYVCSAKQYCDLVKLYVNMN